jgi:hypothetical protein
MSSDSVIDQLSKYGDFDEEEAWEVWKNGYVRKHPQARIEDLRAVDLWLDQQTTVTKEHASLLTRKREMESIHRRLREAGR